VTPTAPALPDELWAWLCETAVVRPLVVSEMRARIGTPDWPDALAVADAILFPPGQRLA
jgi:hypothetical protein